LRFDCAWINEARPPAEAASARAVLLAQRREVLLLQLHQRLVADHVHVGGDRVEQHLLLGGTQCFLRLAHLRFGRAHVIGSAKAVIDILVDGERKRRLVENGARFAPRNGDAAKDGKGLRIGRRGESGLGRARRSGYGRAIAGKRPRHVLVTSAHRSALRVQRRVIDVGRRDRLLERLRARTSAHDQERDARDRCDPGPSRPKLTPTHSIAPAPPGWNPAGIRCPHFEIQDSRPPQARKPRIGA
jgi:hypothetical protein